MNKTLRNTIIGIAAIAACTFGTKANAGYTRQGALNEACEAGKAYAEMTREFGGTHSQAKEEARLYAYDLEPLTHGEARKAIMACYWQAI